MGPPPSSPSRFLFLQTGRKGEGLSFLLFPTAVFYALIELPEDIEHITGQIADGLFNHPFRHLVVGFRHGAGDTVRRDGGSPQSCWHP